MIKVEVRTGSGYRPGVGYHHCQDTLICEFRHAWSQIGTVIGARSCPVCWDRDHIANMRANVGKQVWLHNMEAEKFAVHTSLLRSLTLSDSIRVTEECTHWYLR